MLYFVFPMLKAIVSMCNRRFLLPFVTVLFCMCQADSYDATELAKNLTMRSIYSQGTPVKLAVCTMFHNEAPNLQEWILYHRLVGFERFYLYDNDSDDGPLQFLQPFIDLGVVEYIPWPGRAPQGKQLAHCFDTSTITSKTEWMANFDIDEFVVVLSQDPYKPSYPPPLHKFLTRLHAWNKGAVVLDRMEFGSNSHVSRPPGLVLKEYTARSMTMYSGAMLVGKFIVHSSALERHMSAHDVVVRSPWVKVTADMESYNVSATRGHRYEPIRINHYISRNHDECLRKLTAGRWEKTMDWRAKNGRKMCDKRMETTTSFDAEENTHDFFLATHYPDVIDAASRLL